MARKRDRITLRDRISWTIAGAGVVGMIALGLLTHYREVRRDERLERRAADDATKLKEKLTVRRAIQSPPDDAQWARRDGRMPTPTSPPAAVVAVSNDFTLPTVSMTAPVSGAVVAGIVTLAATASDNVGVAGVQFRLNGQKLGEANTPPYSLSWDSNMVGNGAHALTAVARDVAGNITTTAAVTVTVNNDRTPPRVSITAPASGALVIGIVTLAATASDNVGVAGVQFRLNGQKLGEANTPPYAAAWHTVEMPNGTYTLTAVAQDAAGNLGVSAGTVVTVANH